MRGVVKCVSQLALLMYKPKDSSSIFILCAIYHRSTDDRLLAYNHNHAFPQELSTALSH